MADKTEIIYVWKESRQEAKLESKKDNIQYF